MTNRPHKLPSKSDTRQSATPTRPPVRRRWGQKPRLLRSPYRCAVCEEVVPHGALLGRQAGQSAPSLGSRGGGHLSHLAATVDGLAATPQPKGTALNVPHTQLDEYGLPVSGGNADVLYEGGAPDQQAKPRVGPD